MNDVLIMVVAILLGTGGFTIIYLGWVYLIAKASQTPFKEAWKWWD